MGWRHALLKIRKPFRWPRTEVLGLLFHGRFDQLLIRRFAYTRIGKAMETEERFKTEMAYTEWRRAEQKILYGRTLTRKQKAVLDKLTRELQYPETDMIKLMYARAFNSDGKLCFRKRIETALAALAFLNAGLAFIWIALAGFDLAVNSGASWPNLAIAMLVILIVPGLPAAYLAYCGITPLIAFQRVSGINKDEI